MEKGLNNTMEQGSHYFFAVRIPEQTKTIMKEHIEKLKEWLPFSRWVHYQDIHITLAFLGAAAPEKLAAAEKNVKDALNNADSFFLEINHLGIFGKIDSPRVFWADTEESDELKRIRKEVFSSCTQAGFQLETRPFRPHITLARKWKGEGFFRQELLNKWEELQPEPLMFEAREVVLYQTHLDKVPKYEVVKIFPLHT